MDMKSLLNLEQMFGRFDDNQLVHGFMSLSEGKGCKVNVCLCGITISHSGFTIS